jgi:hypothetical protein
LKTVIQFAVLPHEGLRRHPFTCPFFGQVKDTAESPTVIALSGMRVWAITGMPKKKGGEWFYFLLFCSIFAYAVF